jgi:hypothetical protein
LIEFGTCELADLSIFDDGYIPIQAYNQYLSEQTDENGVSSVLLTGDDPAYMDADDAVTMTGVFAQSDDLLVKDMIVYTENAMNLAMSYGKSCATILSPIHVPSRGVVSLGDVPGVMPRVFEHFTTKGFDVVLPDNQSIDRSGITGFSVSWKRRVYEKASLAFEKAKVAKQDMSNRKARQAHQTMMDRVNIKSAPEIMAIDAGHAAATAAVKATAANAPLARPAPFSILDY